RIANKILRHAPQDFVVVAAVLPQILGPERPARPGSENRPALAPAQAEPVSRVVPEQGPRSRTTLQEGRGGAGWRRPGGPGPAREGGAGPPGSPAAAQVAGPAKETGCGRGGSSPG